MTLQQPHLKMEGAKAWMMERYLQYDFHHRDGGFYFPLFMAVSKEENAMNETIIRQMPVSNCTTEEYRKIVATMAEQGYEISDSLKNIRDGEYITAIVIDNDRKTVFQIGITVAAAWCIGSRYPINGKQFFRYYDKLITEPDVEFYRQLIYTVPESKSGKSCNIETL